MAALLVVLDVCAAVPSIRGPVLRLREPASGRPIILVGTMHYNPASAALAGSVVQETACGGGLHSVLVELCPSRWNETAAREWNGSAARRRRPSVRRWLLRDEFVAAFEATRGTGYRVPFELADQPIEQTVRRLAALTQKTARELAAGPQGWNEIARDVRSSGRALSGAGGGISATAALLDPPLIACVPVALLRGVAASPAVGTLLIGALLTTDQLLAAIAADTTVVGPAERLLELALSAAVAAIALRVGLVGLIVERNVVLARSIRAACLSSPADDGGARAVVARARSDDAVVCIMGLAHLNGVRQLLLDEGSEGGMGVARRDTGRAEAGGSDGSSAVPAEASGSIETQSAAPHRAGNGAGGAGGETTPSEGPSEWLAVAWRASKALLPPVVTGGSGSVGDEDPGAFLLNMVMVRVPFLFFVVSLTAIRLKVILDGGAAAGGLQGVALADLGPGAQPLAPSPVWDLLNELLGFGSKI